ncbi:hypothetical protein [Labrys wisconsinensis]|uniref:Cystathionine beta-lyase/cystathionine gamma-synthase n=1 Tax=Labrys wisconsinensis TaxID=425677 RepID=A0ABU0J3B5_9HYPH|nr:hypothetical protein [Labrys wisconsinensis]MDQ0468760.1 cystathionine beta-lyase/cystathionine gamma-synthase [Labrys wisconsinensis]
MPDRPNRRQGPSTRAIHPGYDPASAQGALTPPVSMTSTLLSMKPACTTHATSRRRSSAQAIAEMTAIHPAVASLSYPGLPAPPDSELDGGVVAGVALMDALALVSRAVGLENTEDLLDDVEQALAAAARGGRP